MSVEAARNYICSYPSLIPSNDHSDLSALSTQGPCSATNRSGFCSIGGSSLGFTRGEYQQALGLFRSTTNVAQVCASTNSSSRLADTLAAVAGIVIMLGGIALPFTLNSLIFARPSTQTVPDA